MDNLILIYVDTMYNVCENEMNCEKVKQGGSEILTLHKMHRVLIYLSSSWR
jgi:hypothetical protein